jgi:hypothetical protein
MRLTDVGNTLMRGSIETPLVERAMDMAEAGEASGTACHRSGKTTCMSFVAAWEQWESETNGKGLRNETSEPVKALGHWRSLMEQTV